MRGKGRAAGPGWEPDELSLDLLLEGPDASPTFLLFTALSWAQTAQPEWSTSLQAGCLVKGRLSCRKREFLPNDEGRPDSHRLLARHGSKTASDQAISMSEKRGVCQNSRTVGKNITRLEDSHVPTSALRTKLNNKGIKTAWQGRKDGDTPAFGMNWVSGIEPSHREPRSFWQECQNHSSGVGG